MKMTMQEFLDHLGIEVGQEFTIEYDEFYVEPFSPKYKLTGCGTGLKLWNETNDGKWIIVESGITELLDHKITPLPKYTLTEDEKKLISIIPKKYEWVARDESGCIYVWEREPIKLKQLWADVKGGDVVRLFDEVLTCVKWEDKEPTSLDELRRCL